MTAPQLQLWLLAGGQSEHKRELHLVKLFIYNSCNIPASIARYLRSHWCRKHGKIHHYSLLILWMSSQSPGTWMTKSKSIALCSGARWLFRGRRFRSRYQLSMPCHAVVRGRQKGKKTYAVEGFSLVINHGWLLEAIWHGRYIMQHSVTTCSINDAYTSIQTIVIWTA